MADRLKPLGRGALALMSAAALACGGPTGPDPVDGPPPGADVSEPFPIDLGDQGSHTPGTYNGLPLRLTDSGEPTVAPVGGVTGLVCVGMSNAAQECGAFITLVRGAAANEVSARVQVVNCAVGGHAIERWNDPVYDAVLWDDCILRKLPQAGVRPDQVRVLYHKAANQFTTGAGGSALPLYPSPSSDYFAFHANLSLFASRVREKFPSVQAVYSSSRSFGGFANNPARGEPLSYEEGHALNLWLAENRTAGGVWYGWGAYLWAPDCTTGVTNGAGLCYVRDDYVADGVHPSAAGRSKIARAMHERLLEHGWYRR